jgi:hypothetical protein
LVQIIESTQDAGSGQFVELRVYRSSVDHNKIVGVWQHSQSVPIAPKGAMAIAQNVPGGAIDMEFARLVDHAHRCGVPFVWVNDPDALFPPNERPEWRITP